MTLLLEALLGGGLSALVIWGLQRQIARKEQSRTSGIRALLLREAAAIKAEERRRGRRLGPKVIYATTDGRDRMQGKYRSTQWELHQARVRARAK